MNLNIIILAAGNGKRMYSEIPKVLHCLGGVTMLERVVNTAQRLEPTSIYVVHGNGGEQVKSQLSYLPVHWVQQTKQLGTGHAVLQAIDKIPADDQVLILYGDVPLISIETLESLLNNMPKNGLGLVVTELEDPSGLGRIIRNPMGNIIAIVEHRDANEAQLKIKEINTGILTAPAYRLKNYLPSLKNKNAQSEYYLTDVIALAVSDGCPVGGVLAGCPEEVLGVNDRQQLAKLERYYQRQAAYHLMLQGATLMDPERFDLRGELLVEQDVIIDINVVISGKVTIGANSTIGANTLISDTQVGNHVTIKSHCVIDGAVIEDDCVIGPYARIRPGTHIKKNAHVGNFVEIKSTKLGESSKVNHLTYLGDAVIGKNVNVGAGTITCNYDGATKHPTFIEDNVFIGSNTALVAPIRVGKNATVGAGSTLTQDVPDDTLAITRSKQKTVVGWKRPVKSKKST